MYYRYPIERIATTPHTRFQTGFARMAMYLMPELSDVVYEATILGLRILGSDESALVKPSNILQQIYGNEITLTKPRVRMLRDAQGVKEPIMNVRISAPPSTEDGILVDLYRRSAVIQERDRQPAAVVVRAQAPLRAILGYHATLSALTEGRAELWTWLSHYERLPDPPDGGAA
ncbi:MAG: hypothetical protein ACM3SS_11185 [Rhodospirillaceae bacterium]